MLTSSSFITRSHKRSQRDGLKMRKLDRVRFRTLAPNGLPRGNDELGERSQQISAMEGAVGPRCGEPAGGISGEAWPEQENSSST